jgi:glycosyltransferase involved in cell wall biosynthesis
MKKHKVAIVVTTPLTIRFFLCKHIQALSRVNKVVVLTTIEQSELLNVLPDNVEFQQIPIKREISLFNDIKTLISLFRIFRKGKFSIIHSVTPKAGLLSMIAARCAFVPHRIHTFTGQVWATNEGFKRWFLKTLDTITASLATLVLIDSFSQKGFLIQQRVVKQKKSKVLCDGSISGVDLDRFHPDIKRRDEVRRDLNIAKSDKVVLFVGRLKKDKGILDLAKAFLQIQQKKINTLLVIVGPDEENIIPQIKFVLKDNLDAIRFVPYTKTPEDYMKMVDIFCLPSYREGFGSVIIESAACGIPSVATEIYGLTDAVVNKETGLLVEKGAPSALADALYELINDNEMRTRLGDAARKRAIKLFDDRLLTDALTAQYANLLKN